MRRVRLRRQKDGSFALRSEKRPVRSSRPKASLHRPNAADRLVFSFLEGQGERRRDIKAKQLATFWQRLRARFGGAR